VLRLGKIKVLSARARYRALNARALLIIVYRDRRVVKITIDDQNKKSSNNQISKLKKVEKNGTISKEVRVTEDKETTNPFETFDDEYYSED
jgi:hypothetical protein